MNRKVLTEAGSAKEAHVRQKWAWAALEPLPECAGVESGKPQAQLELKLVRSEESDMNDFHDYTGGKRETTKKWPLGQMDQGT